MNNQEQRPWRASAKAVEGGPHSPDPTTSGPADIDPIKAPGCPPESPSGTITLAEVLAKLADTLPRLQAALGRPARPEPLAYRKQAAAAMCGMSVRLWEKLRAAGKGPKPDAFAGRCPLWIKIDPRALVGAGREPMSVYRPWAMSGPGVGKESGHECATEARAAGERIRPDPRGSTVRPGGAVDEVERRGGLVIVLDKAKVGEPGRRTPADPRPMPQFRGGDRRSPAPEMPGPAAVGAPGRSAPVPAHSPRRGTGTVSAGGDAAGWYRDIPATVTSD
jgi:hypothetical protein